VSDFPGGTTPARLDGSKLQEELLQGLDDDIAHNRLVLPLLPDVAARARAMIASTECSIPNLADLIGTDPVLAARLLKVANSALYRGAQPIVSVSSAVTRLGLQLVKTLVTQLALLQSLHNYSPETHRLLAGVIRHNQSVGIRAHAICRCYTRLDPEDALLAGLVHDIGKLPLLARLQRTAPEHVTSRAAEAVVLSLHTRVGGLVLRAWQLPPAIIAAAVHHENLERRSDGPVDLVDVVVLANIHAHLTDGTRPGLVSRAPTATALRKLGLTVEKLRDDEALASAIAEAGERLDF
jgi:HD-like signal output (HDOD) protein